MPSGLSLTPSLGSVLVSFSDRLFHTEARQLSVVLDIQFISFKSSRKRMSFVSEEFHKRPQ